ncbi:MAG: hypothetical protein ACK47P_35180, partial [Bradyrhizobium sp.]
MPNLSAMRLDLEAIADEVPRAVVISSEYSPEAATFIPDSRRAWLRLAVAVVIGSLGSVGMWSVVGALPVVQTDFGATRGTAPLASTLVMLVFGNDLAETETEHHHREGERGGSEGRTEVGLHHRQRHHDRPHADAAERADHHGNG